ncbi:MAG: hypothetical protein Q4B13_00290 [Lautropia sp.]|nr:hypothetical protein [Lautropia sp.]
MTKPAVSTLHRLSWALAVGLALTGCKSTVTPSGDCKPVAVNRGEDGLSLTVSDRVVKTMGPEYFGFNLENSEFQLSLWDAGRQRVRPEVSRFLKQHFPGALYRYPGGTTSNYHRWKTSVGNIARRKSVRINDWIELPRIEFGVDEYLDFVSDVGGQVWYVLNLKGDIDKLASVDTLSGEAGELAHYIGARHMKVVRWELGNELDRFGEKWKPERYVSRAQRVMAAVRKSDPDARFVAMMADFDAQADEGINASQYNIAVARGLKADGVTEFAQHLYYDGEPDGPPVTNRVDHLCQSIADAEHGGVAERATGFWITEHARWPDGQGEEWNHHWRQSGDLGASLGVADLIIASTQLAQVKGGDLHSLHGSTGPWPMFHQPEGTAAYYPSLPLLAYALLRQTQLPLVLETRSTSGNPAKYSGGYTARGTVMTDQTHSHYSVWAINRDQDAAEITLHIPALAGLHVKAMLASLGGGSPKINNYDRQVIDAPRQQPIELSFDAKGMAHYTVAPYSVSGLTFARASH